MKLNCKVIEDLLPLYLDEVCSEESRQLVEEHLADCEACRKLVEATSKVECKKTEEEAVERAVVKRSFKKVRRRWSVRLASTFFIVSILGTLTFGEVNGQGLAFSNLDDIYRCVKYVRYIENGKYEKASEMVNFSFNEYKLVESVAHMSMKEYEAYMKDRFVLQLEEYESLGVSIEFKGFDMMYKMEDGSWTICLRVDEYYPDGSKQTINFHFDGDTMYAGAASYPSKGKNEDKTERDSYIDEIFCLYSEDLSVWYEDYEIAFEVKEGEKAVLFRNEDSEIEVDGFINVSYGTATYFVEEPFYQDKFETSVPGKYAVLGYKEGKLVELSMDDIEVDIFEY